jgi:hypothetical protein
VFLLEIFKDFPSPYLNMTNTLFEMEYRVAKKSVNLEHFSILTGMFRIKTARQFMERYHSVVN